MADPAGPMKWKLYGLQRTGSNAVRVLIRRNFTGHEGTESGGPWKHGPIRMAGPETGVRTVICIRNPYIWIPCLHRYFTRQKGRDKTICRRFRKSQDLEHLLTHRHYRWANPILRWNHMNQDYLQWHDEHPGMSVVIDAGQMVPVDRQREVVDHIQATLGFTRQDDAYHLVHKRINNCTRAKGPMNFDYYLERRWAADLQPHMVSFINEHVDRDLMDRMGYDVEDPNGF